MRLWTQCFRLTRKTPFHQSFRRPALEALEDRSVPTGFVVTTAADSGSGSLRQAILDANANAGPDSIDFAIRTASNVPPVIALSTPLPTLTDPVVIDGRTESGSGGPPRVVLLGNAARGPGGSPATGLTLQADGCGVFGLDLEGFTKDGISVQSSSNTISGNVIENSGGDGVSIWNGATLNIVGFTTGASGNDIINNNGNGVDIHDPGTVNNTVDDNRITGNHRNGVSISGGASFNTIGGPPIQSGNFARSNLISGNGRDGVLIAGPSTTGNVLKSNWFGLKDDGQTALPNAAGLLTSSLFANIVVLDSPGNQIGSTDRGMQNVISACKYDGILISGQLAIGNVVEGNWIGMDATGTAAVGNKIGLYISAGASDTIVGGSTADARNIISGNERAGVLINSPNTLFETTGNQVLGNWVGLGVDGQRLGGQLYGVLLGAPFNQIGGPGVGDGNVISGNLTAGVYVTGATARDNQIQGNLIGTDPTGTMAIGNGVSGLLGAGAGVLIGPGAVDTRIGGPDAGDGNVISGNFGRGILITNGTITNGLVSSNFVGTAPIGNVIQGNLIGTSQDGTRPIANSGDGIELHGATGNLIGGTAPGARNLISGNGQNGVSLRYGPTTQNLVEGNWIGLDANGNRLGNAGVGIVFFDAPGNVIGGTAAGAGNVISGNAADGLFMDGTIETVVQGNRIGTDPTGTLPRGNGGNGVGMSEAKQTTIGGTAPGAGNLISANAKDGIAIFVQSSMNYVFGNDIGTDETGQPAAGMGNGLNGVDISLEGAGISKAGRRNFIGYPGIGAGNRIAGNAGAGVVMPAGTHNPVRENSIFANSGGGISLLTPTGMVIATPVSTPVLTSVALDANNHPVVQGTLQGAPNRTYYLEFFANSTPEPFGSGKLFLNSRPLRVVTDSQGHASFAVEIPGLVGSFTYFLSATATDTLLNTSDFSDYVHL